MWTTSELMQRGNLRTESVLFIRLSQQRTIHQHLHFLSDKNRWKVSIGDKKIRKTLFESSDILSTALARQLINLPWLSTIQLYTSVAGLAIKWVGSGKERCIPVLRLVPSNSIVLHSCSPTLFCPRNRTVSEARNTGQFIALGWRAYFCLCVINEF